MISDTEQQWGCFLHAVSDKWTLSCQDLNLPPAVNTYDVTQDAVYLPRHRCRSLHVNSTSELQERSHLQGGVRMINLRGGLSGAPGSYLFPPMISVGDTLNHQNKRRTTVITICFFGTRIKLQPPRCISQKRFYNLQVY